MVTGETNLVNCLFHFRYGLHMHGRLEQGYTHTLFNNSIFWPSAGSEPANEKISPAVADCSRVNSSLVSDLVDFSIFAIVKNKHTLIHYLLGPSELVEMHVDLYTSISTPCSP